MSSDPYLPHPRRCLRPTPSCLPLQSLGNAYLPAAILVLAGSLARPASAKLAVATGSAAGPASAVATAATTTTATAADTATATAAATDASSNTESKLDFYKKVTLISVVGLSFYGFIALLLPLLLQLCRCYLLLLLRQQSSI